MRMAKFDRLLALVHALAETADGLTLDEMAERLEVNRRTAERMRDVIALHFDLDTRIDDGDRRKRFFIREGVRRAFSKPGASELAALEAEVTALVEAGRNTRADPLARLLAKVRSAFDDRERRRLEPDLEALARIQRAFLPAGPAAFVPPETLAAIQGAILAGQCVEFDYAKEEGAEPKWRRVIPYGLVHGALTYLVGQMPGREEAPVFYRLDRMRDVRAANKPGCAPDDWDLDDWLERSFGIWRDAEHDIVLRVLPEGAARARTWRFHPRQVSEAQEDGSILIRFRAGGLRELADHLFGWGGELVIEGPEELRAVMRERIALAVGVCGTTGAVVGGGQASAERLAEQA